MSGSILDKYRQAQKDAHVVVENVEGQPYKAFESASNPQRRFDIRPATIANRIVPYNYLTDITHAGGVIVGFSFSFPLLVRIEGTHLDELVGLIREERLVSITEYIPEWHHKPEDGAPVVTSIEICEPGSSKRSTSNRRH